MHTYALEYILKLLAIPSPTGYTRQATDYVMDVLTALGFSPARTRKGAVLCELGGEGRGLLLSAHVDTLGLMVRSVTAKGTLAVTKVGGPQMPTLDGEYCRVLTREGKIYTGTILSQAPASHVFPDAATMARDESHMEVRLDERVSCPEDVRVLGIENGDYIFIDPKFTVTSSGFLKSRFIDDKASAVVLLMLLRWCAEHKVPFLHPTRIYFVVYEEVGHGASTLSQDVDEFVTVDMGCVGLDLAGSEYAVSICAKDSGGPYDYELTGRLISLAKAHDVAHTVDIFPFYGSDVGAALRSGRDVKGALIGTGVCASHGMERTHLEGIEATLKLLYLYLCRED